MEKYKLVIFDFDGTVVDSEPNYDRAKDLLCEELGITMSAEMAVAMVGVGTTDCMKKLKEVYGLEQSVSYLVQRADELYMDIARQNTPVFPLVKELIIKLDELGVPMVIASGTSLRLLHELLAQIGMSGYFKGVYSAEQVGKGKPEPDLFLYAAKQQAFKAEQCLVLEDSGPGVLAAQAAGMACVALPMVSHYELPVFHQYPLLTFKTGYHIDVDKILALII